MIPKEKNKVATHFLSFVPEICALVGFGCRLLSNSSQHLFAFGVFVSNVLCLEKKTTKNMKEKMQQMQKQKQKQQQKQQQHGKGGRLVRQDSLIIVIL